MAKETSDGYPVRLGWVRIGVAVAVSAASVCAVLALTLALGFYDAHADQFSSLSYQDRLYGNWHGGPTVIRDPDVVELARAVMPVDAKYRVVTGPGWVPSFISHVSTTVEADFLRFYLLPRRQEPGWATTRWVFCLGCEVGLLGRTERVIAGKPGHIQFVEVR